ncbi:MAG: S1 RNA-binding domain-containing protein, partial [Planctomycetia bacterium]
MKQEMLINVSQPEECRIAIIEDGVLEELYVERTSQDNYVGNIYKGRIVNIEPSIQAAFVDFGVGRNGFLHISDVEPQYYRQGGLDPDKAFDVEPAAKAGEAAEGE